MSLIVKKKGFELQGHLDQLIFHSLLSRDPVNNLLCPFFAYTRAQGKD